MNNAICPQCWKPFRVNGKGRRRVYCSKACRMKAHRRGLKHTGCQLCNLRALLRQMMAQIAEIPVDPFGAAINNALADAYDSLAEASLNAVHDCDGLAAVREVEIADAV